MSESANQYIDSDLTLELVSQSKGFLILEFGENWCPICQNARPVIEQVLNEYPKISVKLIKDGKGKKLGRQLKIKLWPTLVLFHNGQEQGKLIRPESDEQIKQWLSELI